MYAVISVMLQYQSHLLTIWKIQTTVFKLISTNNQIGWIVHKYWNTTHSNEKIQFDFPDITAWNGTCFWNIQLLSTHNRSWYCLPLRKRFVIQQMNHRFQLIKRYPPPVKRYSGTAQRQAKLAVCHRATQKLYQRSTIRNRFCSAYRSGSVQNFKHALLSINLNLL